MPTRLPALRVPPITFAHRGARAHAPENTLEAFSLAVRLGARGLESDVWLTADGAVVLDHDGVVGSLLRGRRRRRIADLTRAALPDHIPTLGELYGACGTDLEISLDVKDPAAIDEVVATARAAGGAAPERLWLCHPDLEVLRAWRPRFPDVRLVDSTRLARIAEGPERRAATLRSVGIDALNLHHSDWSGGLTTLVHRFGVHAFGWDAQFPRVIAELVDMGIDAVYSDHVDRLVDTVERFDTGLGPSVPGSGPLPPVADPPSEGGG
ncbi:MAG TPA: glycerophosphodiester phosphodiesterase [Acidimicrobiales bacterium]|nr:glycerophosphodiester phosphodiesterase [Acidimicrobiales bacterium]